MKTLYTNRVRIAADPVLVLGTLSLEFQILETVNCQLKKLKTLTHPKMPS